MTNLAKPVCSALFAVALISCGTARSTTSLLPASGSPAMAPTSLAGSNRDIDAAGKTRVVFTLPPIQVAGATIVWASKPRLLSSATQSIVGSVGSKHFGPLALSPATKGCVASSKGLQCTLKLVAAPGQDELLQFSTYAAPGGSGPALATSSSSVNVYAGQTTYVPTPSIYGIALQLVAQPQVATVEQGNWRIVPIILYGIDAADTIIPSNLVYNRGGAKIIGRVNVTFSGLSEASVVTHGCCGTIAPRFLYDGVSLGTETFTPKAKGVTPVASSLTAVAGPTKLATILVGNEHDGGIGFPFIAEFASSTNGNSAPVRSFSEGNDNVAYGEDAEGNFWLGATHYSNIGTALGSVTQPWAVVPPSYRDDKGNLYAFNDTTRSSTCAVFEFAGGTYGLLREIDYSGCTYDGKSIAVDATGDVFVSVSNPASILEFPPSGSGALAPIRTITLPAGTATSTVVNIDVDAAGNLYVLYYPGTGFDDQFFEYTPGSTTPQTLLAGVPVKGFAVDDSGGIYARVYSSVDPTGPGAIEYFPAGSSTPAQTIAGTETKLSPYIYSITVPRSVATAGQAASKRSRTARP